MEIFRKLRHRVGRRGGTLLVIGLLDMVFSISLLRVSNPTNAKVYGALLPLRIWAMVWIAAGLLAWASAFMRSDRAGYVASAVILTYWGWLSVLGWINDVNPNGWITATFFLVLDGLVIIPATWPEVRDLPAIPIDDQYPDAVITATDHGIITGWLGAAERMFGWTADEIIGKPITVIMPITYRHVHETGIARVRETGRSDLAGRPLNAEGLHRDGSEFPVQVFIGVHHTGLGVVFSTTISHRRDAA